MTALPLVLKALTVIWAVVNGMTWLQIPLSSPSDTLFTASDLLLASMIIGGYAILERQGRNDYNRLDDRIRSLEANAVRRLEERLGKIEQQQARMMEHLGIKNSG